jgi:hypothetical protein
MFNSPVQHETGPDSKMVSNDVKEFEASKWDKARRRKRMFTIECLRRQTVTEFERQQTN